MGREWLFKATGSRDGGKSPFLMTGGKKEKSKNRLSSGCMSAIYNLFDVQNHQFRLNHPSFMSSEHDVVDYDYNPHSNLSLQGIEAPRNSLECPELVMNFAQSSSKVKEHTNLNVPVSRLQIKTTRSNFTDDSPSECQNSPSTKTPNLVARLMGLDLLPEYSSPRPSTSSATTNTHRRSCSLPTTPRLSTASRLSTDNNEYHHRLSLQIDKENVMCQDLVRRSKPKRVTNKVKERHNRRVGADITNVTNVTNVTNSMLVTRNVKHVRRDSNLDVVKPKKTTLKPNGSESREVLRSPKLRLLDIKSNFNKPVSDSTKCQTPRKLRRTAVMKPENVVKDEKIKRIASERYDLRLKKMKQQEKVNVNNIKKVQSHKNEMTSSSSITRLSRKVSLPSNQNSSYNSNDTQHLKAATTTNSCSSHPFQPSTFHQPTVTATTTAAECEMFEWDTGRNIRRLLTTAYVAEVEDIVVEIECHIMRNLVHEIVMEIGEPVASYKHRRTYLL